MNAIDQAIARTRPRWFFHPEGAALVRAARLQPDADLPKLVLADWLQEHDEPGAADTIRSEVESGRLRREWGLSPVELHHVPNWLRRSLLAGRRAGRFVAGRYCTDGFAIVQAADRHAARGISCDLDHWGSTTVGGRSAFVNEPYADLADARTWAARFAALAGLTEYGVSDRSWWFPGHTVRVWFLEPQPAADLSDPATLPTRRPIPLPDGTALVLGRGDHTGRNWWYDWQEHPGGPTRASVGGFRSKADAVADFTANRHQYAADRATTTD